MKALAFVVTLLVVLATSAPAPLIKAGVDALPGRYIIVMKSHVSSQDLAAHLKTVFGNSDNQMYFAYDNDGFRGFSGNLTVSTLNGQRNHPDVDFVEEDRIMRAYQSCSVQSNAEWGLDRISEQKIDIDGQYPYSSSAGSGVDSYIIDTGILITHNDFEDRAVWGANYADETDSDCNGHGTHVAGTVGGKVYGVAKKTDLIAVKVLSCDGSGTNAGVIAGVDWVTSQYQTKKRPSVANMSLGGGKSTALDAAVKASINAGVTYAVAAGNENSDACNGSPSNVATAITVGATTIEDESGSSVDERASFSNYGRCVTLFAPGQLIKSAWIGSNSAIKTISGTSMASPHVAGAVAVYLGNNPDATPAVVKAHFLQNAASNVVDLLCANSACRASPNKFLYSACA